MEERPLWPHVWGMKAALILVSISLMSNAQQEWRRALDRANGLRSTDPSGARREFQTAEQLAKQVGGESVVVVWTDLAGFLIEQGQHGEAEALLRNALPVQDDGNPNIPAVTRATILNGLALTQRALGRRDESINLLRKVIALLEGAGAMEQGLLLPSINLLSHLYVETGRMSDAKLTIRKAMSIAGSVGKNPSLANTCVILSEIERAMGNYAEARRAARNALQLIGSPTPDNALFFERVHNQLARIAYDTSNYQAAAAHWKLVLASLKARRAETDDEVLSIRADIARTALVQGRLQEAEKELIAVVRLAEDHGSQIALALGLYGLGTVYAQQNRFDKATTILVRSLAITDEKFGELSPNSVVCVADLAKIYLKTRKPAEAVKFSGRAARIAAEDDAVLMAWLHVMQIHSQVLQKLNRKSEAKEFHERASRITTSRRVKGQTVDVMDLMR